MTTEIQQTRYDQIIRRVAGIIGPGSKVAEVITELFPMINVEDLPAELLRLGGTRLCFGGGVIGAVAAEAPVAQLFNPPGSGTLVTVTSVTGSTSLTSVLRWGVSTVVVGIAQASRSFRDTRDRAPSVPIAEIREETATGLVADQSQVRVLANTPFTLIDQNAVCVLAPGTGLHIGVASVNIVLSHSFVWRERPALDSELNL